MTTHPSVVLVAEDQPSVRRALVRRLSEQGHRVLEACDGSQAVALIAAERPDLVLMDIRMPLLDGLGVLESLKRDGISVPVIMLTANDDIGVAKEALRLGARDYLLKPFDMTHLERTVAWQLGGTAK